MYSNCYKPFKTPAGRAAWPTAALPGKKPSQCENDSEQALTSIDNQPRSRMKTTGRSFLGGDNTPYWSTDKTHIGMPPFLEFSCTCILKLSRCLHYLWIYMLIE